MEGTMQPKNQFFLLNYYYSETKKKKSHVRNQSMTFVWSFRLSLSLYFSQLFFCIAIHYTIFFNSLNEKVESVNVGLCGSASISITMFKRIVKSIHKNLIFVQMWNVLFYLSLSFSFLILAMLKYESFYPRKLQFSRENFEKTRS